MEKSQNPSAVRSRGMLERALLELMAEQPYAEITVTALCERAQLGRKTFYRNYREKDDVLRVYIDGLADGFLAALRPHVPFRDETFARIMFSYWEPHAALFGLLRTSGGAVMMQQAFERVSAVVSEWFVCPEEIRADEIFLHYCMSYVAGGCYAMLRDWLRGGAVPSAEQMTALFCRIRRLKA